MMVTEKDLLSALTPDKFIEWLDNQPDEIEYTTDHICNCPVACYLRDTLQVHKYDVFISPYYTTVRHVSIIHPKEFGIFIQAIDAHGQGIISKAEVQSLIYLLKDLI